MHESRRCGRARVIALVLAICSLVTSAGHAQSRRGSLRLVVEPARPWVVVGSTLSVQIGLRDERGQPSLVQRPFAVTVSVTPPVAGAPSVVTILPGRSSATLQLRAATSGILEIRATHPEAFEGGAFVRVVLRAPTALRFRPRLPSSVHPAAPGGSGSGAPRADRVEPRRAPASQRGASARRAQPLLDQPDEPGATRPVAPGSPPAPAGALAAPHLTLRCSKGPLLAGRDAATISAFVQGDDPDLAAAAGGEGFKVDLFASAGTLSPVPLVVQGFVGSTKLTSDQPGVVTVEFMGSQPPAEIDGDRALHIQFEPPIDGLRLASPCSISLVESAKLHVKLVDTTKCGDAPANGCPELGDATANGCAELATDKDRDVHLRLVSGHGEIADGRLKIKSERSSGDTDFFPAWIGKVIIVAESASMQTQVATLEVTVPVGPLVLSVTGGLLGGLLVVLLRRGTHWTRVAIGGVTGFLLYWAFLFKLLPVLPRSVVVNPLGGFSLSILGGWLGTEVIERLLQRLGLATGRQRERAKDRAEPARGRKHGARGAPGASGPSEARGADRGQVAHGTHGARHSGHP